MPAPALPGQPTPAELDALHDDLPAWRPAIEALARQLGWTGPATPMASGTVLVALLGSTQVLKLYPPFLRDHFEFERALLDRLAGRLALPTPTLLQHGALDGWAWLRMTQLPGRTLTEAWPGLVEAQKCAVLATLGALAAQVHALPVADMAALAPAWPEFLAGQQARCAARQQRTGLPAHLLAQLDGFLAGPLPQGHDVILTGEYTPMNLLAQQGRLSGMFDFGDGLVGPREYDWLGPLAFLAAGHADRCRAYFDGYGVQPDAADRLALMRLLLLHRYSHLPAQIAHPGWQTAPSFDALSALIWP